MSILSHKKSIVTGVILFACALTVFDGYFITDEGNETVIKRAGKAVSQTSPGPHLKILF